MNERELVQQYKEIREAIDLAELEVDRLKDVKQAIEAQLIAWWEEQPLATRPTTIDAGQAGKVTFANMRTWKIVDRLAFEDWVEQSGVDRETFWKLHSRSVNSYCREVSGTGEPLPGGTESHEFTQVRFKK